MADQLCAHRGNVTISILNSRRR